MSQAAGAAPEIVQELFRKANAERWTLSLEAFAQALDVSIRHAFAGGTPSRHELERYCRSLHVADLALAAACARGNDAAWDHFVLEHRPVLYRAADALDPAGGARELADSLYADLYGIAETDGERKSLFRYFHGRSSLATWLRAVLSQRHVDAVRARRRIEPLPDDESAMPMAAAQQNDLDRPGLVALVENALRTAVDALAPKDRLRLRSYYVAQLTLAEIGRVTGEHEATVSRHLARTRRTLRVQIERHLRGHARLADAQVRRAFELILEDPGELDLREIGE